ncbi:hypothetical protein Tco_1250566 [Tanacetum coccineum]
MVRRLYKLMVLDLPSQRCYNTVKKDYQAAYDEPHNCFSRYGHWEGLSKQPPKSGMETPIISNSFDVLDTLDDMENSEGVKPKHSHEPVISDPCANVASTSDPVLSNAVFDFGNPESDEDEVLEPDDTSYMSSFGGGNQLEDDFSDGYEAQVYDLPGQLDAFCDQFDIRLKSHGRK